MLMETPPLLALNVSDCVEVLLPRGSLVKEMYDNVVLSGARTCHQGMPSA